MTQTNAALALRVGTTGAGGDLSVLVWSHAALRVSAAFWSMNGNGTDSDVAYTAKLRLHSVVGLLDVYPGARGSFHLSVGAATNPAVISATGQPSGSSFKINGTTYSSTAVGSLTGTVQFASVAPYVGLGFGTPAHRSGVGVYFLLDMGAIIAQPTVSLSATGAAANPALASNLKAQADTAQQDIQKYAKLYPVVSLGFGVRF